MQLLFRETKLKGSFEITIEKLSDDRGFFGRVWDKKIFEEYGLNSNLAQCNVSRSMKEGTIRGMHYQISPYEESKLIRCTRGKILDVIIDLRKNSSTYKQWISVELSSENYRMLYVPEGFGHGFQSLVDDTEIFYQVSQFYTPGSERGIRWDDSTFNIEWPLENKILSEKDKSWPDFSS